MLHISFLACTKVELWDLKFVFCSKWRKISKLYRDLDLGPTMPNIDLVRDIFIYYNVFKFHVPGSISFRVIVQKHTQGNTLKETHTQKHTHTDAHKDSNEYSIVAFCKNATIIKNTLKFFILWEYIFKLSMLSVTVNPMYKASITLRKCNGS